MLACGGRVADPAAAARLAELRRRREAGELTEEEEAELMRLQSQVLDVEEGGGGYTTGTTSIGRRRCSAAVRRWLRHGLRS